MQLRGWVYVLTNRAMPGLLKVGFSTKDPWLRVEELNGTGLPHPFKVEYDVIVHGPKEVEQAVHRSLSKEHEAKEFFRLSLADAIITVREVVTAQEKTLLAEYLSEDALAQLDEHSSHEDQVPVPTLQCPSCHFPNDTAANRCVKCFGLLAS